MVVALVSAAVSDEFSWPLFAAGYCVFAALIPHVAGYLRPPLGQLPGISVLINYALCFAHRFVIAISLTLVVTTALYGWSAWESKAAFVAVEALILHGVNWIRYKTIARVAAGNVAHVLHKVTPPGQRPPVRHDDPNDELARLRGSWFSLFTMAPIVVFLYTRCFGRRVHRHSNIKYLRRGEAGTADAPSCYLDVEYSTDPSTYQHYKQRPVAVYVSTDGVGRLNTATRGCQIRQVR